MSSTPYNAVHVTGDTYVVPGLTNSGWIGGLLIDTCDDEAPYALVRPDKIAITHGHADHFAIAHALRRDGAPVVVARDDASLVENPDINIRGMFSWAKPSDMLVTKLFRGLPCSVDAYVEDWEDERASALPLPGHTMGHYGFLTIDNVLFTGDALYLMDLWERHPLPYAIDPGMVVRSLQAIRAAGATWVVPAHGRPVEGGIAQRHVDYHIQQVRQIEELIVDRLAREHTTEGAIAMVSAERGLGESPAAYWLAVATVKGYLGELLGRGELEFYVRDHAGWWRTIR